VRWAALYGHRHQVLIIKSMDGIHNGPCWRHITQHFIPIWHSWCCKIQLITVTEVTRKSTTTIKIEKSHFRGSVLSEISLDLSVFKSKWLEYEWVTIVHGLVLFIFILFHLAQNAMSWVTSLTCEMEMRTISKTYKLINK
jgi:hypothetical protein